MNDDFKERLIKEHADLKDKKEALHFFISSVPTFNEIHWIDQQLLKEQYHHMSMYHNILTERMKRLGS